MAAKNDKLAREAGRDAPNLHAVPGHMAYSGPADLDRLIHERIRLGIVSALAVNESLTFNDLKQSLGATDAI